MPDGSTSPRLRYDIDTSKHQPFYRPSSMV